jgi:II/X family phage/plasmid replication protein
MWFCDWLSGRIPFKAAREVNGGYVRVVGPHGEAEYTTVRRLPLRGSFDDTMQVRSIGDDLEFSGNPTKWLQGHNLYGPNALVDHGWGLGLMFAMALDVAPDAGDVQRWLLNEIRLTRMDATRMYRPEWARPGWVPTWLAIAGMHIHGGRQKVTPASQYDSGTIYVGKGSRRISMVLYDKAAELRKHPPRIVGDDQAVEWEQELGAYAADTLRVELRIHGLELKERGLQMLSAWTPDKGDQIMDERIAKLGIPDDLRMTEGEVGDLPRKLREVYALWRAGDDLRQVYSKPTFYRHRRALLAHGIDIAHVRPRLVVTEREYPMGRPLKDYLAGGGMEPPASAIARGELIAR